MYKKKGLCFRVYYNKLIKRNKLIKYWVFFGGEFKLNFKLNYNFFSIVYSNNLYISLNKLILCIKNILPLFINISFLKGKVLFITSKWLYSKIIYNKFYLSLTKELLYVKTGIFSNFSKLSDIFFNNIDFRTNPSILIFFFFKDKDYLILEAKKKKIITVGLINTRVNSTIIDYPIMLNSEHFYTNYFFSKFLFKLIFLEKNVI
jgi:ribosomal protein S2